MDTKKEIRNIMDLTNSNKCTLYLDDDVFEGSPGWSLHIGTHDDPDKYLASGVDIKECINIIKNSLGTVQLDSIKKVAIANPHLSKKYKGMKVSASGVLGRIARGAAFDMLGAACGQMLEHLEEMSERFYSGDISAVDEFLQLYCLDSTRPSRDDD